MFGNVFQSSKSALAFAGAVVVTALILVGSKESGGVLDKAVATYKTERASFAENAAAMSAQMSAPVIEDYKPSGLEESASGVAPEPARPPQVIRLDPVTLQPIGEVPAPTSAIEDTGAGVPGPVAAVPTEPTGPREAVVTSRMIRIEPN